MAKCEHHLNNRDSLPHTRHILGFLAGNLHMGIAPRLWPGLIAAARKHDVHLFCFPGGGVNPVGEFDPERSVIYRLVDVDHFDGLVSSGASAPGGLDPQQAVVFLRQYQPLPMVSLTRLSGEIPHVTMDSYQGMQAVVRHLTQAHGLRRLAFVRGPENHYYAQERYQAYIDVLQEQGIPLDPRLITPPLPWEAGEEAVRILIDERGLRPGPDLQAIVTVSDLTALGMLNCLQARGIQVPDDLVLTGFNNSAEGRFTFPPLTSVSMPFFEQGERVIEMLVARLDGQTLPLQVALPTRLVVRQSCGCPDQGMILADMQTALPAKEMSPQALTTLRQQVIIDAAGTLGRGDAFTDSLANLVDALYSDLQAQVKTSFLPMLESVLHSAGMDDGDASTWQDVISVLRRNFLPCLDSTAGFLAENLFGQARLLISGIAQRSQALEQLQAQQEAEKLRQLGQMLITTFDTTNLANVLAEQLPEIGIASCYLALYEMPVQESCRLILAYTEQGRVDLGPDGLRFSAREVVPSHLLPQQRQLSYVVEPLYFQREQIGFAVFEVGPLDGGIYELLRTQISSALKGALLLQDARKARQAAEKADRIKTRLLANVSHELRTPLNIILGYSQDALGALNPYEVTPPQALLADLEHIRSSAEHQLRVVNDLLDLSRAEIDELDLYLELLDPYPLLQDAFQSIAGSAPAPGVTWRLRLPERLPLIQADPVRLRQILLNILSNARKFTIHGQVVLGAQVEPPYLHLWIEDTGTGISPEMQERIFEPFVTAEHAERRSDGIGLGLSITRRLVALHNGSMKLESQPGSGSIFHIYLPLPNLADKVAPATTGAQPVLLLISSAEQPTAEIVEMSQRQGLALHPLQTHNDLDTELFGVQPAALAWDLAGARPGDWAIMRRLRNYPRLSQLPFILYGQAEYSEQSIGLTSMVVKPASADTLLGAINALCPPKMAGPILVVDDDPVARQENQGMIKQGLPDYPVYTVNNGAAALAAMAEQVPSLVVLDLMMPEMDGFDVLDQMRGDARTQAVPVIILTSKVLNLDDIKRIEQHRHVIVQSKGILADDEIIASLHRSVFGSEALPLHTSALVKRAIVYLHQNYTHPLTRWEIAEAVGVSENYLTRVFNQELGLSPWDYLNRFRVSQAKELLHRTQDSVKSVANQVGFKDQKYFSRVFHKMAGVSPNIFREQTKSNDG